MKLRDRNQMEKTSFVTFLITLYHKLIYLDKQLITCYLSSQDVFFLDDSHTK